jgi:hypothetical protein
MFEAGVRQQRFVQRAYALGFKYHAGSVWPALTDTRLIDGGLLILSRFPIVERSQHAFSQGSGSDGICAKGVLYARVQLSPDLSDSLHVFTTHTQAGDRPREYGIRSSQLQELTTFVAHTLRDDPYSPLLITGDFNLDARHDLSHDPQGHIHSRPCSESLAYQTLFSNLHTVLAAGRKLVDLMKTHDTTKLEGNVHPITNGDGHATLVHTGDPCSPDKDGKCIDYMFFSPGIRERRSVSGDIPTLHLQVVPEETRVDHGDVASTVSDVEQLPITHLSDHYGLRTAFEIELTPVGKPDGSPAPPDIRLCEILQLHFPPRAFAQRTKTLWQWKVRVALLLIAAASGSALYLIGSVLRTVVSRGRGITSA